MDIPGNTDHTTSYLPCSYEGFGSSCTSSRSNLAQVIEGMICFVECFALLVAVYRVN